MTATNTTTAEDFVKSNYWTNPKVTSKSGVVHKAPKGPSWDRLFEEFPDDWFIKSLKRTFDEMEAKGIGKFDITVTLECVNRRVLNSHKDDDEPESLA